MYVKVHLILAFVLPLLEVVVVVITYSSLVYSKWTVEPTHEGVRLH